MRVWEEDSGIVMGWDRRVCWLGVDILEGVIYILLANVLEHNLYLKY